MTTNSNSAFPYRAIFGPVNPASKSALNALTVTMPIELEPESIKVNAVSPGFTRTNLNGYAGTETVEEGACEAARVALLGPDGLTGTFTRWRGNDPMEIKSDARVRKERWIGSERHETGLFA